MQWQPQDVADNICFTWCCVKVEGSTITDPRDRKARDSMCAVMSSFKELFQSQEKAEAQRVGKERRRIFNF
jgi:hypothetical protein